VELEIPFHSMNGTKAMVSVFFDRDKGGRRTSGFIDAFQLD
jgi:hypothetical protein